MVIGETFGVEIRAAGLTGLPFSWDADGVYGRENLNPGQQLVLDGVVASHNPLAKIPPIPKSAAPLTAEELADHLVTKSVTTQAEIDAIKDSR